MNESTSDNDPLLSAFVATATQLYGGLLDKFGSNITKEAMKDASSEETEAFIKRLKDRQIQLTQEKLLLILSRIRTDQRFAESYDSIMKPFKRIEELREDNEIANNHLQSVENERSILQRDTDLAIDKLESVCEAILEHQLVTVNNGTDGTKK